jgi:hypothetical protein
MAIDRREGESSMKVLRATLIVTGAIVAVSLAAFGVYVAYVARLWHHALET